MLQPSRVNLVMDGQWGSAGKGKLAGYLALRDAPEASVCNFMTNAGHYFRSRKIGDFMVQQLPMAAVNRTTELYISAGAAITLSTLFREIEMFERASIPIRRRLHIDRHAAIITPEMVEMEKKTLVRISSTVKGCGATLGSKVMRAENVLLAKDVDELAPYITVVADQVRHHVERGDRVLGELAQGFDLSLNHGTTYPFVTSRDITPMAFMSDIGLPSRYLGNVYGVLRTYPIRVGNVYDETGTEVGHSGPMYGDQQELSWELLSDRSGKKLLERTTVTGKVRRVFTFSLEQLNRFIQYCAPTHLMLNFCNYFPGIDESSTAETLYTNPEFTRLRNAIRNFMPVDLYGTGADNDAIIDLEG